MIYNQEKRLTYSICIEYLSTGRECQTKYKFSAVKWRKYYLALGLEKMLRRDVDYFENEVPKILITSLIAPACLEF
jgi:hypothetical protein